jgi:FAD/FMN-containing dehydrogenase
LGTLEWANHFKLTRSSHMAWAGAANIEGGVTIDLRNLNEVTVSADKSIVSVGAGNNWAQVYEFIEPLGLATSGGRWGNVGVGGLLTGGEYLLAVISSQHLF